MTKQTRLLTLIVLLTLSFCQSGRESRLPQNVLLITLDTTRFDYFSYALTGAPRELRSPEMENLVKNGTSFTQAVTSINSTNPSHLSILTSQYPARLGVHSNTDRYSERYPTLAEILKQNGYHTAAAVSAFHLGSPKFDILRGFTDRAIPQGAFTATEMTDLAIQWLTKKQKGKFLLWLHYFDPHAVYTPPAKYISSDDQVIPESDRQPAQGDGVIRVLDRDPFFARSGFGSLWQKWIGTENRLANVKRYYMGEVLYMCSEIGRMLRFLENSADGDNTLIVIVADHGESLGEHGIYFDHTGLYEPQVRVPLVFYHASRVPAGRVIPQQVRTIDILPTVLDLLGVSKEYGFEGASLSPLLFATEDSKHTERTAVVENTEQTQVSIRSERWKYILPLKQDRILQNPEQIFDLSRDPQESINVLEQQKAIAGPLNRLLEAYLKQSKAGEQPELTNEELEKLRSLGYVN